ncbi:LPXTG cell wall anchor domain-containing protein [Sphingomonas rubra]|nr:LPXTG cell wall anchor domain-containing protein [Sphingomonas rubra]
MDREVIAYAIIAAVVLAVVAGWALTRRKRKIEKLRRRGIKTYGH